MNLPAQLDLETWWQLDTPRFMKYYVWWPLSRRAELRFVEFKEWRNGAR